MLAAKEIAPENKTPKTEAKAAAATGGRGKWRGWSLINEVGIIDKVDAKRSFAVFNLNVCSMANRRGAD